MFSPRWLASPGAEVLAGGSRAVRRAAFRAVARPRLADGSSTSSSRSTRSSSGNSAGAPQEQQQQQPRQKYVVVGSFIFKKPGDDPDAEPLVALVRRSKVNKIYTHLYGPVSGKIEPTDPDPLSAALREIAEETNLSPNLAPGPSSHLSLLAVGQPYSFVDVDVDKEFEVHPFAFALRREAAERRVRLCAENDEWRWFRPGDVVDEGTVPKVRESLGRIMRARWEAWPAPEG